MFRLMILLAGLTIAAWSVSVAATAATRRATAHAHTVHVIVIANMQYGPMPTAVHAGDTIEWVNHDIFEHSVTARDGRFDLDLKPGAIVRMTTVAGTTEFFCKFHPGMTGTLVVR